MAKRRPKGVRGVLSLFWACLESAAAGRTEHTPTAEQYPESVVRRVTFTAGGRLGWKISALVTPRETPAPLKLVVVPGAPSWAEYWAPLMAALPADREMVVVDRPGFAASEPATCVPDIRLQAIALAPLLEAAPGQKILLVGQSYGAAIATVIPARPPVSWSTWACARSRSSRATCATRSSRSAGSRRSSATCARRCAASTCRCM